MLPWWWKRTLLVEEGAERGGGRGGGGGGGGGYHSELPRRFYKQTKRPIESIQALAFIKTCMCFSTPPLLQTLGDDVRVLLLCPHVRNAKLRLGFGETVDGVPYIDVRRVLFS